MNDAIAPPRQPRILAIGGAHVDRRGRVRGRYHPGASNPGTLSEDVGGGVFNALRNAVAAGATASLMSLRGGDQAGEAVAEAIALAAIEDLSVVFLDRRTPSYTALIDAQGELIAGLADMELYDLAFGKQLRRARTREAVAGAEAILTDANLPAPALGTLAGMAEGRPLFAIGVSPAKVVRLAPLLGRLACLFVTAREAASLAGLPVEAPAESSAVQLRRAGLAAGVVTAGDRPLIAFDRDGAFRLEPPKPRRVADVTGAGDALAGVAVAGLAAGLPLRQALRRGAAAAMLTLESAAAVADFTPAELDAATALVAEPQAVAWEVA